jgi:hypothetical protein
MPADKHNSMSAFHELAEYARIGMWRAVPFSRERIRRAASSPSISGIWMSMRMMSKEFGEEFQILRACHPF